MEQELNSKMLNAISIYDWTFHELEEQNQTILLAWGLDQNSKPSVVRIEDFPFTCYVEMPEKIHEQAFDKFGDWLKKTLREDAPTKIRLEHKRKIYYYRFNKTYPMAKLEFKSMNALRHCERLLAKDCSTPIGKRSFPVYEHKISPIRKLLTERNLVYSGWITGKFEPADFDFKISTLEQEYVCSYKTLRQPEPSELFAKTTYPTIFSFDIECYSSNPKAMPKKTNAPDVIFAVSCIFARMGAPSQQRQKYLIAIGEDLTVQDAKLIQVNEEEELLIELRKLIKTLDPDIVVGYNIFGFDIPYTDFRIQRYTMSPSWGELGRIRGKDTTVKKLSWESSAFGHNDFYQFMGLDGRICLDLLPIVKRDYKLLRYDLDFVSNSFLGKGKFPIKAKQIFGYTKEYNEALERKATEIEVYEKALLNYNKILDYCVQDSDLVFDLLEKLTMWIGLTELSNIVGVSIVEIFTRGQQIRCLSQIYDLATRENIVIDTRTFNNAMSFSGGFVQEPLPGLYDNVICLDFASLYPSIIMAFNICYTTLLENETEVEDEKVNHFHIDMDASEVDDGKEDDTLIEDLDEHKDEKKEGKIQAHHRFVKKDVYEGVLPRLVSRLVNERRAVRKMLEGNKDPIMKVILDKRQLALKVSANSVFGFLGVVKGKLPLIEGAMSITAKGRELIGYVNKYLEEKYNGRIVYNDSVAEYTPILIKQNEKVNYIQIRDLCKEFYTREDGKEEQVINDIEIWSDQGWTKIKRVIRHKTEKQMFRILTHTGLVDATEDHSLINSEGIEISPKDVSIGQKLLHKDLPSFEIQTNISEELAWVYGFFFAEGSCETFFDKSGKKSIWAIANQDCNPLQKAKNILESHFPDKKFVIGYCVNSSNCNKLQINGSNIEDFVKVFRDLFYTERNSEDVAFKKVPTLILNAPKSVKKSFLDGYYEGDGIKALDNVVWDNKGHIGSAGLYYIATSIGYKASLNIRKDEFHVVRTTCTETYQMENTDVIKKILNLGSCSGFVYDIETENHHFAAGVGRMIVHNTDSSMVDLGIKDTKLCNEWGNRLSDEISKLFPPPLKIEYEKAMTLLALKKKKYAAFLVDKHGNLKKNKKDILVRGIILARRDTLPWLQNKYSDLLYNILCRESMMSSIKMIYSAVEDMMLLKLDLKGILIVRQLSACYKNENYFMNVFAKKLKALGHLVTAGDRMEYLITKNPEEKLLGNKLVTLDMFQEGGYELDVLYYLDHCLKNPIDQLFSVGHKEALKEYSDIGFQTKRKLISLATPIAMIVEAFKNGATLEDVKQFLSVQN